MIDGDPRDYITNPAHYLEGRTIEPIDVIEDWKLDFRLSNVIKYVARAGRKSETDFLTDLKKARWYLERVIAEAEKRR